MPGRYETGIHSPKGDTSWYDVQIGPIKHNGQVIAATLIKTDITKLKQIEDKLGGLLKESETEVKKLLKQKDEFVKQLAHDLKNPLNPIVNLLPMVEEREQDSKSKEMLKVIIRNVDYMKNLAVKTIQLAQLNTTNAKFSFKDLNLFDNVNTVIEKNKFMLDENNMEIINNISKKIMVRADKLKLEELFDNLVNNAIKYSPNGGFITIDAKDGKDFITISVKDTGFGMNEEQLSHIFEEFYKIDSIRRDFKSDGLGLPICNQIAEKLGGRIWAESLGHNKGSTFYFTVPIGSKMSKEKVSD